MCSYTVQSNATRLLFVALLSGLGAAGCGEAVNPGVFVNTLEVSKRAVGPAPSDIASHDLLAGTLRTRRVGDLVGDAAPDVIVEDEIRKKLEIRSAEGVVTSLPMAEYISDFAVIPKHNDGLRRLVIHTYPNADRGSTFTVVVPSEHRVLNTWTELPPASRGVRSAVWRGREAVFYMVRDELVIRSLESEPLSRLTLPGINSFSTIQVENMASERTVLVLSGDGYTPYHAIVILNADGTVAYHEHATEHAFGLKATADDKFQVATRSQVWEFTVPSS